MGLPQYLLEFLGTAPYVAIIIWYTLTLRKQERDERAQRDTEWREFLAQQMAGTLRALDAVAVSLKEQNECIKSVDARTTMIWELLEEHDRHAERVANAVDTVVARTERKGENHANLQAVQSQV